MSGHFATLLRGTVVMLPEHDVYLTDWHNGRDVPLGRRFHFDDFIDDHRLEHLGPAHIVAIQPAVAVLPRRR